MPKPIRIEMDTSNPFSAITPEEELTDEGTPSEEEELESYSNNPLDPQEDKSPTPKVKKGPGRPKKGQSKVKP